jgi:trehalose 6-phosphate synthase/phosphatase
VKAEMFPLGIDFEKFNHAIEKSEVSTLRDSIIANFSGKKIIFSVDRLDYTKGVTHRLSGFERFLELYPEWRERVVFILVVVPSRQIVSKYNERKKLIEEEIGRINGRFSSLQWQPIIYRYNHLSFSELCAMYNSADVALVTPLRDGMNLVAKEYVASRKGPGVLILSELAGAASELSEAIMVNPMDKDEVGHAIFNSLIMPTAIQKGKLDTMQQRLRDYTVVDWMNDFIKQLDDIRSRQISQQARHLNETSIKRISNHFLKSKRRLLLLDYDGTLVPYSKFPSNAIPDKTLLHLLKLLSDDSRTDITIISGRDSASLESWFGDLPINLVSEHGAGVRLKKQSWKYYLDTNQSWKSVVRPMLEKFTRQSPGSFVEDKKFTLVWHYRNVPHDLGFVRSRELLNNLHHLVRNSPLHVLDGNKVIEVRVAGIDKGTITRKLLRENHYEFVMAIGDDKTDEDMFKILDDTAYTIKIGSGQTSAQYHLTDQFEVLRLLSEMIDETELVNLGV